MIILTLWRIASRQDPRRRDKFEGSDGCALSVVQKGGFQVCGRDIRQPGCASQLLRWRRPEETKVCQR